MSNRKIRKLTDMIEEGKKDVEDLEKKLKVAKEKSDDGKINKAEFTKVRLQLSERIRGKRTMIARWEKGRLNEERRLREEKEEAEEEKTKKSELKAERRREREKEKRRRLRAREGSTGGEEEEKAEGGEEEGEGEEGGEEDEEGPAGEGESEADDEGDAGEKKKKKGFFSFFR